VTNRFRFPLYFALISLTAVSWGCGSVPKVQSGSVPKVQRQVTVFESVNREWCVDLYGTRSNCSSWEGLVDSSFIPSIACLGSRDLNAKPDAYFKSLLGRGALVVGSPTELEGVVTRFSKKEGDSYSTICYVRKYIMEGSPEIFDDLEGMIVRPHNGGR